MNNNKIKISIITPFFNSKKLLINHFNQSKKFTSCLPIELIYIDDNSKDGSYEFIKKKIKGYRKIKLFKLKKNYGPGIARNIGIKKSKGEYLIFLDADDTLIFNAIKKLIKKIQNKTKNNLIFFNYIKNNSNQANLSKLKFKKNTLIKKFLRTELDMGPNFYLYNRKFLNKNKIFFKKGFYEDILFILKVFTIMKTFTKFKFKLYKKNNIKNSISNTYSLKHLSDFNKSCLDKYNFFLVNILGKVKNVSIQDLQYGLRGDYVFSQKLLKNCKHSIKKKNMIDSFFKKIISENFVALTNYDKIVKRKLFKKVDK